MWSTPEVLRLLAAVPLAMLFVLLLRDHREDRSARATLFFLACSLRTSGVLHIRWTA